MLHRVGSNAIKARHVCMKIPLVHGKPPPFGEAISNAFKELLSKKHLYQSCSVSLSEFVGMGENPMSAPDAVAAFSKVWTSFPPSDPLRRISPHVSSGVHHFERPKIRTHCAVCDENLPHLPLEFTSHFWDGFAGNPSNVTFTLLYECSGSCNGTKVVFLVARDGIKLTLAGRTPMEQVQVPSSIPRVQSKFFRDAVIAYNCGQFLPGLFMLRTFIEQVWRADSVVTEAVSAKLRPTGDELAAAYKSKLSEAFKSQFSTLAGEYYKLSEALHAANPDQKLFAQCKESIEVHFDALRNEIRAEGVKL
jgi:hypothetical protein